MRGFCVIGLDNPKSPINVGSVLRTAYCFGATAVVATGRRYKRTKADTQSAYRHLPLIHADDLHEHVPFDCVPVAVDLVATARPIKNYVHPERAFYVFGAEDATLGSRILDWCRDVIYLPTRHCLNLACCVSCVLQDRASKGMLPEFKRV